MATAIAPLSETIGFEVICSSRPRLTAWIRDHIQDEIDAGHYSAPEDPELLADGIVTIGERFLHHGGDPDVTPDPTSAGRMIALLLREPCDAPSRAATPAPAPA